MKDVLTFTVKQECDTRWSTKFDAEKAVHFGLDELVDLLETMSADTNETSETRGDAQSLLQNIVKFNFITLLAFWYDLLSKTNRVQNRCKTPLWISMNHQKIWEPYNMFLSKKGQLVQKRFSQWQRKMQDVGSVNPKSSPEKKKMDGEQLRVEVLTAEMELTRVMKSVVDRVLIETDNRFTRLNELFRLSVWRSALARQQEYEWLLLRRMLCSC